MRRASTACMGAWRGFGMRGVAVVLLTAACDGELGSASRAAPSAEAPDTSRAPRAGGDLPPFDAAEDPGRPALRYVGRFDTRDVAGPRSAWPGGRIIARFEGTQVSVRLEEMREPWMTGGPSEWDVAVDGVWRPKLVMQLGESTYALATGLAAGTHSVELYKRSEAQNGITRFLGYDFGGGQLLTPPPAARRRLEVIGDSTPAGYGIEGVGPDCGNNHAARFQNFHRSFGARLGELFDADVSGIVFSGKGLTRNAFGPDRDMMHALYNRSNPLDPTSATAFPSFVPDVVVVMLGGLDFALGEPMLSVADFVPAYTDLLAMLRAAYAQAQLFAVISPSTRDAADRPVRARLRSGVASAVERRRAEGDTRVTVVTPAQAVSAELTGCASHGNPQFHERLAQELAVAIRTTTGWD